MSSDSSQSERAVPKTPEFISRRYEVLEELGRGAMGTVLKVRHVVLGRVCALKVLPRHLARDPEMVARFHREARILATLSHPNIVHILDVDGDEIQNLHYLVMEYIEGQTLKQHLEQRRALPLTEVLDLAEEVGRALEYAHSRSPRIVHRDIKPSNIMIEDKSRRIVVMDFGIAKQIDDLEMTRIGSAMGTLKYSAPEQLRQEPLDASADVYSLGMVLYEALTGAHLFAGLAESEVVGRVLVEKADFEPEFPLGTSPCFARLVAKAIAKSRSRRYTDASEFLHALDACRKELEAEKVHTIERAAAPAHIPTASTESTPVASGEEIPLEDLDGNETVFRQAPESTTTWESGARENGVPRSDLGSTPGSIASSLPGLRQWPMIGIAGVVLGLAISLIGLRILRTTDSTKAPTSARRAGVVESGSGLSSRATRSADEKGVAEEHAATAASRGATSGEGASVRSGDGPPHEGDPHRAAGSASETRDVTQPPGELASAPETQPGGHHDGPPDSTGINQPTGPSAGAGATLPTTAVAVADSAPQPGPGLSEISRLVRHTAKPAIDLSVPLLADAHAFLDDRPLPPSGAGLAKGKLTDLPVGESQHILRLEPAGEGATAQEIPISITYYPKWEMKKLSASPGEVYAVAVSGDGARVVAGTRSNVAILYDASTGDRTVTLAGHKDWVNDVAFSADGSRVLSGSKDHTLKLWDASSGAEVRTLTGHKGWVNAVALSSDGRTALSGSDDHTVKLWDVEKGEELRTFAGHQDWVLAVALSPRGDVAASGARDQVVKLWSLATGEELATLKGHRDWVNAVAFSPDGKMLASASDDQTIKLWNLETAKLERTLTGHRGWVVAVAFSPDGKGLVSASRDQTVRLWDVASGKEMRTFQGHRGIVPDVAFAPDGMSAFSGGSDQTVRQWFTALEPDSSTQP